MNKSYIRKRPRPYRGWIESLRQAAITILWLASPSMIIQIERHSAGLCGQDKRDLSLCQSCRHWRDAIIGDLTFGLKTVRL